MKKIFNIDELEKKRILEMHKNYKNNEFLISEQKNNQVLKNLWGNVKKVFTPKKNTKINPSTTTNVSTTTNTTSSTKYVNNNEVEDKEVLDNMLETLTDMIGVGRTTVMNNFWTDANADTVGYKNWDRLGRLKESLGAWLDEERSCVPIQPFTPKYLEDKSIVFDDGNNLYYDNGTKLDKKTNAQSKYSCNQNQIVSTQPNVSQQTNTPTQQTNTPTQQGTTSDTKMNTTNDSSYDYMLKDGKYYFKGKGNVAKTYPNWVEATGKGLENIKTNVKF